MKRGDLIKAIPFTIVAMMILGPTLKEKGYVILAYVCYAIIVVGAVFILANRGKTSLDEKARRPQLIMLAGALIFTLVFFIFQYYQVF